MTPKPSRPTRSQAETPRQNLCHHEAAPPRDVHGVYRRVHRLATLYAKPIASPSRSDQLAFRSAQRCRGQAPKSVRPARAIKWSLLRSVVLTRGQVDRMSLTESACSTRKEPEPPPGRPMQRRCSGATYVPIGRVARRLSGDVRCARSVLGAHPIGIRSGPLHHSAGWCRATSSVANC